MRPRTHYSYNNPMINAALFYDLFHETLDASSHLLVLLKKKYRNSPKNNLASLILDLEKHLEARHQMHDDAPDSEMLARLLTVLYAVYANLPNKSDFFPTKAEKLIQQIFMRLDVNCD